MQTIVVIVLTLTRIIKSVVTGQAPVTLEWRNTPRKKNTNKTKRGTREHKQNQKWYTFSLYRSLRMLRQKNIKTKSESAYDVPGSDHWYIRLTSQTFAFQLLDKPWSQVSSLLPPGPCLYFLSRMGFSNPTARRFFIECR